MKALKNFKKLYIEEMIIIVLSIIAIIAFFLGYKDSILVIAASTFAILYIEGKKKKEE